MRRYLAIFVTVAVVIVVLVAVNAASYVEIEQTPDSEYTPDRSTYNARATGTRALFDYLQESGHKVVRWREHPERLLSAGTARPATFVVIGPTPVEFETEEVEDLLQWVEAGGRLVVISRVPDQRLLPSYGHWYVFLETQQYPAPDTRSSNPDEIIADVPLARPAQPTALTTGVDSALASRFAAVLKLVVIPEQTEDGSDNSNSSHTNANGARDDDDYDLSGRTSKATSRKTSRIVSPQEPPPPAPVPTIPPSAPGAGGGASTSSEADATTLSPAPVIHLSDSRGPLLADYRYGAGRIIILGDPFIVANNGINRADNLRLALNLVAGADGIIAFDEYHHGRAATQNQLISYFAGTPVLPMLGQLGLIVLAVLWTRGSRFARALPLPYVDRRSKLEFVASMAELQQRSRAYDLAIENIYARTRRVLARYGGLDSNSPRALIAERVAARSKLSAQELEALMRECEDAMAGEPLNARQALNLVTRLREVERTLGLRMRSREAKQAKER